MGTSLSMFKQMGVTTIIIYCRPTVFWSCSCADLIDDQKLNWASRYPICVMATPSGSKFQIDFRDSGLGSFRKYRTSPALPV